MLEKHPSRIIVDVGGVGYDVQVPLSTFYGLGEPGATVALRIHTHVREDRHRALRLCTPLEQDLFERLISISGIGPKLGAGGALRHRAGRSRSRAIRTQDVARLTKIPGRRQEDRRADWPGAEGSAAAGRRQAGRAGDRDGDRKIELRDDLLSALVNLGYQRAAAEKAIDSGAEGIAGRGRSSRRCASVAADR